MAQRAAVTIRRPIGEVESAWAEHFDSSEGVSFTAAPRDQGTEVRAPTEDSSELEVKIALRRFKQVLETGEVVRSEGTPEGVTAERLMSQEPAQPPEDVPEPVGVSDRRRS
jgi:hypothetical protein